MTAGAVGDDRHPAPPSRQTRTLSSFSGAARVRCARQPRRRGARHFEGAEAPLLAAQPLKLLLVRGEEGAAEERVEVFLRLVADRAVVLQVELPELRLAVHRQDAVKHRLRCELGLELLGLKRLRTPSSAARVPAIVPMA